jgi:hypothetical protein
MGNDEISISGIPISGALAVIALILGILVIPQTPFKGSRPKSPETVISTLHEGEDVQARLWQDPFSAVMNHRREMANVSDGHDLTNLAEQIINKDQNEILVLGVMVDDGSYAENVESRTRYRYAVLSALSELYYVPENSEHVGYLENLVFPKAPLESWLLRLSNCELFESKGPLSSRNLLSDENRYGSRDKSWFMDLVPYEWFESEHPLSPALLVVWLNDNNFSEYPLWKLGDLTGLLNKEVMIKSAMIGITNSPDLRYRILGPASSTNLDAMIKESKLDCEHKRNLKNVQIFSWAATVDMEKLIPESGSKTEAPNSLARKIEQKCRLYKKGCRFLRTIGPDRMLTDLLIKELSLRIEDIEPTENIQEEVHIALISEWDTVYGRNLPDAFKRSVEGKNICIHRFSYMRGIDGQVPGEMEVQTSASRVSKKNDKETERQNIERPTGRSQFDYLRRLAFRLKKIETEIKDHNRKSGIQAIGVLGSDVYDKLLVIQAMRKLFPATIFFTTDMDARLFHPDELLWTQNLIVASNFGLRLNDEYQENVPPFRNSYQTSLFLSTKIALNPFEACSLEGETWLCSPKIFEIGRTGAFALDFKEEKPDRFSTDPNPTKYSGILMHPTYFWRFFGAAILLAILFYALYAPFRTKAYTLSPCFLILFLILLITLFRGIIWPTQHTLSNPNNWLYKFLKSQFYAGEPFAFFEGISIWPSEFLRFLAGGISLYFLITGYLKARSSNQELSDRFFNPQNHDSEKGNADEALPNEVQPSKMALTVWNEYQKYTNWKRRLFRILPISIIYSFLCHAIIYMFGQPFVPYRNHTSFLIDRIAIPSVIPFFILLLISVVDFTISSRWLIRRLSQVGVIWPWETARDISAKFNMNAAYLNEWLNIKVIVKISETAGQFIYYPFIVILILGASRLRYFDRWNMPLGLLIVILLGLLYSIYCAVSLRSTARKARETELQRLWKTGLSLKASNDRALSEQIKIVYDAIGSMRKGAFVPFFEQPFVRAVALFLGGGGGLVALNYL